MDKSSKKLKGFGTIILIIYMLATALIINRIHRLGILPFKYEMLAGSVLIILFLLLAALFLRVKNKPAMIIFQIINGLMSIILLFGSFYISRGTDTIDKISGANQKTYTMSLLVKAESEDTSIQDLNQKSVALISQNDPSHLNLAMEEIKSKISDVYFYMPESYKEMLDGLYFGDYDAILINEAYRSMLEVEDRDLDVNTRVIWNYEIHEDAKDIRKSVNVINTPFTVYISGIDTYGSISTVSRTDVNMLVTVNPITKQVLMTSIPRDAWVKLADMQAYDKLTHSGIGGIENSVETIENFMGIEINYYVRVNFSSVVTVVDALDGIDVYSDREINHGSSYIYAGMNHLDGQGALSFARERHAYDDMYEDNERGDQRRVENQQAVLEAIIEKMISPTMIKNYHQILSAVEGMFETNMSSEEMISLISMQLNDMADWEFIHAKVSGEYEYQYGGAYMPDWYLIYYITDSTSVKECADKINAILHNEIVSSN